MSFLQDTHHRINQALAASGGRVVLPEDWAEIDALADAMDFLQNAPVSVRFDNIPEFQAMAGEMRRFPVHADETEYDTRWCPEFDPARPETMSRYYLLIHGSTTLFPLSSVEQVTYAAEALMGEPRCQAHITADCHRQQDCGDVLDEDPPIGIFAHARGEIVCAFYMCALCFHQLQHLTFNDWPEYAGPWPWTDSGPFWFDPGKPTCMDHIGIPPMWGPEDLER